MLLFILKYPSYQLHPIYFKIPKLPIAPSILKSYQLHKCFISLKKYFIILEVRNMDYISDSDFDDDSDSERDVGYPDGFESFNEDFTNEYQVLTKDYSYKLFLDSKKKPTIDVGKHALNMLNFYYECFQKGNLCDITIKTNSRSFDAHRVVLAMFSDYFRAYLHHDGKGKDVITLVDVNGDILHQMILYAYTGHIEINDDTVEELVICSDYLGVQPLKDICENALIGLVSLNSCFRYWELSDMYTMKSLSQVCLEYFRRNFATFIKHEDFFKLSPKYLMLLLEDCELRIYNSVNDVDPLCSKKREEILLKAVLKTIENSLSKNNNELTTEFLKLLESVKLPEIDTVYIEKQLKKHSSLKEHPAIKYLLDCVKIFKSRDNQTEAIFPKSWYTQRLLAFCKFSSGRKYATVYMVGREDYNICCPVDLTNIYRKLSCIKLFFRRWDRRLVVGGIELQFDDGCVVGGGENRLNSEEFHEVRLQPNEVITKVTINSGWLIDSLMFTTNIGNTYGPYGGDGGGTATEEVSECFLHSISFSSIRTQMFLAPIEVQFHWLKLI